MTLQVRTRSLRISIQHLIYERLVLGVEIIGPAHRVHHDLPVAECLIVKNAGYLQQPPGPAPGNQRHMQVLV